MSAPKDLFGGNMNQPGAQVMRESRERGGQRDVQRLRLNGIDCTSGRVKECGAIDDGFGKHVERGRGDGRQSP